jgi:histidyl-tRNA synthetase
MRDFLETHNLLTSDITAPMVMVIPAEESLNLEGQRIAQELRGAGISVAVDISGKKVGKKIERAAESFVSYALVFGEDEIKSGTFIVKNLEEKKEVSGTLSELASKLTS